MAGNYRKILFGLLVVFILAAPAFAHARCGGSPCPIVIVPGMLASFDKKLMYQDIEDNKWGFVPLGNVYKALIKEFKINGFTEGEQLFIAYYDWRKPVSENWSKYLKPKIDEAKRVSGKDKVDLVAHSMGGLLARAYIQSNDYKNDVNKLVMMGTPNYGAAEAYVVWEGGQYPQDWIYPYKYFFETMEKSLKKKRNKRELERPLSFREFFPSIRDLLPTQPYVKMGNEMVAIDKMADKNSFLLDLNNNINSVKSRVVTQTNGVRTYSGSTGKTMETIKLGGICTAEDNANKRWRDGHPNPDPPTADSSNGDETVLLSSAKFPGISDLNNMELAGTAHTKIPDDARYFIPYFLNPPMQVQMTKTERLAGFAGFFARIANVFTAHAQEEEWYEEELPIDDPDLYVAPTSVLGFTLSPNVSLELTDPDGNMLAREKNEFGEDNANFDDDPDDPDDIILVTIRNPKTGKYTLKLTGNTAGDYYVDSTYVNDNGVFDGEREGSIKEDEEVIIEASVSENSGVDFIESETPEDNPEDTTTPSNDNNDSDSNDDNGESNSSGPNTAKDSDINNRGGRVLGTAMVRMKLSATVLWVRLRLEREFRDGGLLKKDFNVLVGPLNDLLTRARLYDQALKQRKPKVAAGILLKMKGDYADFANKVDVLIKSGRVNRQTTNVLTTLSRRLGDAGLR